MNILEMSYPGLEYMFTGCDNILRSKSCFEFRGWNLSLDVNILDDIFLPDAVSDLYQFEAVNTYQYNLDYLVASSN